MYASSLTIIIIIGSISIKKLFYNYIVQLQFMYLLNKQIYFLSELK
jgi:hypothetical protein